VERETFMSGDGDRTATDRRRNPKKSRRTLLTGLTAAHATASTFHHRTCLADSLISWIRWCRFCRIVGLFRSDYAGRTLRERLGVARDLS